MMTTITKVDDEVDDEEWGEWEDEGDWEASVGSDSRWTEIGLNSFVAYCIYHYRIYCIYTYMTGGLVSAQIAGGQR